jgi:Lon protease-like protein
VARRRETPGAFPAAGDAGILSGTMSELLPLFPLGTVLFPGMVLPLHVFEERYRQMVRDLLDRPEPREFGVITIRKGREVGTENLHELHEVGCVATLREVVPHPDGRFDLVAVGSRRFRLLRADQALPYHQGEVEEIADEAGGTEPETVRSVQAAFREYLNALADRAGAVIRVADIPDEPLLLSYVVAAAMIIDVPERQGLLAAPDALSRLRAERQLLTRERAMLHATTSRPAPDLSRERFSPN